MLAALAHAPDERVLTLPRKRLFFWVFLILTANGLSGMVIRAVGESNVSSALLSTFGVSAIAWAALAAGLFLLAQKTENEAATPPDIACSAAACLFALMPVANLSSFTMTAFAAYVIWSSKSGSYARRAAAIFLAITANLIWGRLLLGVFSRDLLFIDAFFVTNFIGSTQTGNTIPFIGHPGRIIVAPSCSSLQGISLAIVFWVTLNQLLGIKMAAKSILWCVLAILAAFAINIFRIAALVHFPAYFEAIHVGWGDQVASFSTMFAIVGITVWGARRELFS